MIKKTSNPAEQGSKNQESEGVAARGIRRVVMNSVIGVLVLGSTLSFTASPAKAAVSSPFFSCFTNRIYMQAPIVTGTGGASGDIVYWIPEIVGKTANGWVRYWGEYQWASLYGGSTNLGWHPVDGSGDGGVQEAYNLPKGQYRVMNWVYYESSGQWEKAPSVNERYLVDPQPGENEHWCKNF